MTRLSYLRINNSGSLAIFAAIRRAVSWGKKEKALGVAWGTLPRATLGVCARSRAGQNHCTKEVVGRLNPTGVLLSVQRNLPERLKGRRVVLSEGPPRQRRPCLFGFRISSCQPYHALWLLWAII
jgi:hypothetical protein